MSDVPINEDPCALLKQLMGFAEGMRIRAADQLLKIVAEKDARLDELVAAMDVGFLLTLHTDHNPVVAVKISQLLQGIANVYGPVFGIRLLTVQSQPNRVMDILQEFVARPDAAKALYALRMGNDP